MKRRDYLAVAGAAPIAWSPMVKVPDDSGDRVTALGEPFDQTGVVRFLNV